MTSRVLLRERELTKYHSNSGQNSNLHSFASTGNLNKARSTTRQQNPSLQPGLPNSLALVDSDYATHQNNGGTLQSTKHSQSHKHISVIIPQAAQSSVKIINVSLRKSNGGKSPFAKGALNERTSILNDNTAATHFQSVYTPELLYVCFLSKQQSRMGSFNAAQVLNSRQSPNSRLMVGESMSVLHQAESRLNNVKQRSSVTRKKGHTQQNQQPKQRRGSPKMDENNNHSMLPPRVSTQNTSNKKTINTQQTPTPKIILDLAASLDLPLEVNQGNDQLMEAYQEIKLGQPGAILAMDLVITLIKFDNSLFGKFLLLSPTWHTSTLQALDEYSTHFDTLFFKQSYSQTRPIIFCRQKGIRLDRIIQCEVVKENLQINHTLRLGYQARVHGDTRWYKSEFKLDVVKKGTSRTTWVHKDSINKETYTQPIQQVCIGDTIELAMSIFSLQGFVSELIWEEPVQLITPKLSVYNYNKDVAKASFAESFFGSLSAFKQSGVGNASIKIYCDLNRICELEDAVVEWYEEAYYQRRGDLFDLSFLKDNFTIKEVMYAGVDGAICKANLTAIRSGLITQQRLGMEIRVKDGDLCNEIKRIGYLKDRETPLEVRVGDTIILYLSKTSA